MLDKYQTLQTIYELVKEDSQPTQLTLIPRQIILRQNFAWDIIVAHLQELKAEGLLHIRQLNTAMISITSEGIAQALTAKPAAA